MYRFLRFVLVLIVLVSSVNAYADHLLIQRGDSLYKVAQKGNRLQLILVIGKAPDSLWATTMDGERIAYLFRVKRPDLSRTASTRVEGLHSFPAVVYTCDQNGRQKRRLLSTADLRDRQGRRVTQLSVGQDVPSTDPFDDWEMESIAWSNDGRTLYFCCLRTSRLKERATFAVDARTGAALVDGQGHWKAIAPFVAANARDSFLTGAGTAFYRTPPTTRDTLYNPLMLLNLADGTLNSIPASGDVTPTEAPEYGSARAPALSPDAQRIAFSATAGGLWLTDLRGTIFYRLQSGTISQVRWSADGKRLYFISLTSTSDSLKHSTLFTLPAPKAGEDAPAARPMRVLEGVERFAVLP